MSTHTNSRQPIPSIIINLSLRCINTICNHFLPFNFYLFFLDGLPVPPDKEYLRDEILKIDESWAVPRFDTLPNVVHILTSRDRENELHYLKEQIDIVEEVVDEVVHAYHSAFNKAIQNYSQIIAKRPLESKQTTPHLYFSDVILNPLLSFRKELKENHDIKVSVNDIVIKAVVVALKNVQEANGNESL
ncbi:unnamed protein product [Linum trigynum]|uniref:Exocyst complex component Sec8 n=1 Tax=Linum trigynum TaxID=586398 RepID=A0AAV2F6D4_9ROSI